VFTAFKIKKNITDKHSAFSISGPLELKIRVNGAEKSEYKNGLP